MKSILKVFLLLLLLTSSCAKGVNDLKILTLNVRYDNPDDGLNAWPNRKQIVSDFIKSEHPDMFGLQEALWHQYSFIDSCLTGYSSVAAGRDDGMRGGEMTPLFFRNDLFSLKESGTFWLSETPGVPGSKGWGAVLPRIVTWARLSDLKTGNDLFYFNTHFSHMSDSARIMSARVLYEEVMRISGASPFIITGDFNMTPDSKAYSEMGASPVIDSYISSLSPPGGLSYTFNGFNDITEGRRIDYIFVRKGISVKDYTVKLIKQDSVFISDHWPVEINIRY